VYQPKKSLGKMKSNGQVHRYKELDALRGIAALMVVFFHFSMHRPEANLGLKLGITGVDLFFMISGFVIFMSLQKVSNGTEFIINRVSRLYPTYWAAVTFTFALIIFRDNSLTKQAFVQYAGNMTMFQFYLGIPNLDGPYWTMTVEMLFYIFILCLYWLKLLKHIELIGIGLCLFAIVSCYFFFDRRMIKLFINLFPLAKFIALFVAGIIFYKIYTERAKLALRYSTLVCCLACQLALFSFAGPSSKFISFPEYCSMIVLYFVLFVLFVNNGLGFIVNKVTLFLGKISFALYLIHQFVSLAFIIPLVVYKLNVNFWVATIFINLPIVICIAAFITYKIEVPFGRLMKEKLRLLLYRKERLAWVGLAKTEGSVLPRNAEPGKAESNV
jgi:peptidoglycan/LPS O-acetylase OafA/YrhL